MIYLDNAATTWPKPPSVIEAVTRTLQSAAGNPGRTQSDAAMQSASTVMDCRIELARLFGLADPLGVVFTANTTEALNIAIKGLVTAGDHVVTSAMEHNAVWRPLVALAERDGVTFSLAEADRTGLVSVSSVAQQITAKTRLIVLQHASNVSGTIQPIAEVAELARAHHIPFLLDAAQSAGVLPLDMQAMGIDLLAFPGHKGLLGPQGTGGLCVAPGIELRTLIEGGTGSESSNPHPPARLPEHLEAGTQNLPGIAGLGAAALLLTPAELDRRRRHEWTRTRQLLEGLLALPGATVYGPPPEIERTAVVSFNLKGWDPVVLASELERRAGIASRAGLQCAWLAHRSLGTETTGTLRLSPGSATTDEEIVQTLKALQRVL